MLHSIRKVAAATKEVSDFLRCVSSVEARMKSVAKLVKQLGKAEASKAKDLWSKVEKDASTAIDAAVKMHKKLSGTSEFASLGKSIRGVEIAADGKSTLLDFQAGQVLKALETLYGDVDRITALAKSGNLE